MALGRLGAKRLNDLDTDSSIEAIHARLQYEQTRDALLRSHWWRFASARAELSQDTSSPAFEWDYQFQLPSDFLRMKHLHEDNFSPEQITTASYALEGNLLLTNNDEANIRYIKQVTDVTEFDPLFIEALVLQLAVKLVMPLTQDANLRHELNLELEPVMAKIRTIDRQETNTVRRDDRHTWADARAGSGRVDSQMGS